MTTNDSGFTFVELLVVVVLLGILSVTAIARLSGSGTYAPLSISQSILQQTRLTAQSAQSMAGLVSLNITHSGGLYRSETRVDGALLTGQEVEVEGVSLIVRNGTAVTPISAGTSLEVSFQRGGEVISGIAAGTTLDPNLGIELQIAGRSSRTMCLFPTGYMSERGC